MGLFNKKRKDVAVTNQANPVISQAKEVSNQIDIYEDILLLYSNLICHFLSMSDSGEKVINTWDLFSNGLELEDILSLDEKFNSVEPSFKTKLSIPNLLLIASLHKTLIIQENNKYYLSMKMLVEIFFTVLAGGDGLNIISDYLEENDFIDEDGIANYAFHKDGPKVEKHDVSYIYNNIKESENEGQNESEES